MNVTLPNNKKITTKQVILYIIIAIICIMSIIVTIYVQLLAKEPVITSGELGQKEEEEAQTLKTEFDKIFTNKIENDSDKYNEQKVDSEKELVFTNYEKKESKINSYDFEIHIPYINIKNETIEKYNKEIEDIFVKIANNVLKSENKNILYTVEYAANINNNILSIIIKSNLKEGSNAQKVIVQTYNYNLKTGKELTLPEVLKIVGLNKQTIQSKINSEIQSEQKKSENLKELGYNVYSRDSSDDMYKVENTKEFYLKGKTLYIVYAYGNDDSTSEMDLIII